MLTKFINVDKNTTRDKERERERERKGERYTFMCIRKKRRLFIDGFSILSPLPKNDTSTYTYVLSYYNFTRVHLVKL